MNLHEARFSSRPFPPLLHGINFWVQNHGKNLGILWYLQWSLFAKPGEKEAFMSSFADDGLIEIFAAENENFAKGAN